jgi:hypothetical protein
MLPNRKTGGAGRGDLRCRSKSWQVCRDVSRDVQWGGLSGRALNSSASDFKEAGAEDHSSVDCVRGRSRTSAVPRLPYRAMPSVGVSNRSAYRSRSQGRRCAARPQGCLHTQDKKEGRFIRPRIVRITSNTTVMPCKCYEAGCGQAKRDSNPRANRAKPGVERTI